MDENFETSEADWLFLSSQSPKPDYVSFLNSKLPSPLSSSLSHKAKRVGGRFWHCVEGNGRLDCSLLSPVFFYQPKSIFFILRVNNSKGYFGTGCRWGVVFFCVRFDRINGKNISRESFFCAPLCWFVVKVELVSIVDSSNQPAGIAIFYLYNS